jgi:hypothetical protein
VKAILVVRGGFGRCGVEGLGLAWCMYVIEGAERPWQGGGGEFSQTID